MFNAYKYHLSFKKPFVTAAGTFTFREGVILRYHNSDTDKISEVAPLPGFSKESLPEVVSMLSGEKESVNSFLSASFDLHKLSRYTDSFSGLPSLQFGLSMLGMQILADRKGKTVSDLLERTAQKSVKVNAVAGSSDPHDLNTKVTELYAEGFRVIKCKVLSDPGHLPDTLSKLYSKFGDISFRLDANQSWPKEDVARFTRLFSHLPVEYIEEPCLLGSAEEFDQIAEYSVLPLAADESIIEFGVDSLSGLGSPPAYFILKPMFLGNLINLFATMNHPNHLVDKMIFTTALESVVGRRIVARISAMYGSPKAAHGLNTGMLFKGDLAVDNSVSGGQYRLDGISEEFITFHSLNLKQLETLF